MRLNERPGAPCSTSIVRHAGQKPPEKTSHARTGPATCYLPAHLTASLLSAYSPRSFATNNHVPKSNYWVRLCSGDEPPPCMPSVHDQTSRQPLRNDKQSLVKETSQASSASRNSTNRPSKCSNRQVENDGR